MPTKKMRVRAQDIPYMTKEWKDGIRAKRTAARKYLKEQTSEITGKPDGSPETRLPDSGERQ